METMKTLFDEVKKTREEFIEYANSVIRRLVEENMEYLAELAKTLNEVMDWPVTVDKIRMYWVDEDLSVRPEILKSCTIYKSYLMNNRIISIMRMRCSIYSNVEFYVVLTDSYVDRVKVSEDTRRTLETILTLTDRENIETIVAKILEKIEEFREQLDELVRKHREQVLSMKREVQTLFSRLELVGKERVLGEG